MWLCWQARYLLTSLRIWILPYLPLNFWPNRADSYFGGVRGIRDDQSRNLVSREICRSRDLRVCLSVLISKRYALLFWTGQEQEGLDASCQLYVFMYSKAIRTCKEFGKKKNYLDGDGNASCASSRWEYDVQRPPSCRRFSGEVVDSRWIVRKSRRKVRARKLSEKQSRDSPRSASLAIK